MGLFVFDWMRPPITYALMPFLVGLPLCVTGSVTIEIFSICAAGIGVLYLWKNKIRPKSLIWRRGAGMFFGMALVAICNHGQNRKVEVSKKENENSGVWKMMPPRELGISIRIIERSSITTKNEMYYVIYGGNIISAPDIRRDLLGKKASWIEGDNKRNVKISEGDIVSLVGTIEHKGSSALSDDEHEIVNNEQYLINNEVVLSIEQDDGILSYIRRKIYLSIIGYGNYEAKHPGFEYALLMGDRSLLKIDQIELFKETGTMHLFAVSGLHVGIVFLVSSFILRRIISNRNIWIIAALSLVFGYVALVGYTASACRAFIMVSMWRCSLLFHKKSNPLSSLYWASIILLLISPSTHLSLGFQLSFTVVLSILFCLDKDFSVKKLSVYKYFRSSFLVSYSSFFGSSLLMIDNFHFINPFSILINIVLVNVIVVVFCLCILHVVITIVFDSQFLSFIIEKVYCIMDFSLNSINQIKFFQCHFDETFDIPNFVHLIYPLILILVQPYLQRLWHKLFVLSCLPLAFLLVCIFISRMG